MKKSLKNKLTKCEKAATRASSSLGKNHRRGIARIGIKPAIVLKLKTNGSIL